jgi:DNA-binding NarL/FixJ family response regulator
LKPDVILVDIGMPLLNGLDVGQQVKRILPAVKLVYLTMNSDAAIAAEAFHRGASGYLLKTSCASDLVRAVRDVLRGKSYLSPNLFRDGVDYLRHVRRQGKRIIGGNERLTERQREVLQLLAEGKRMKAVSSILKVSTRTVAFHKYRIMEIVGARNNAELVRYALKNCMVA